MDDLVAELRKQARICETSKAIGSITKDRCEAAMNEAASRIQALEAALAEAEGRVIAEVVAWLRHPDRRKFIEMKPAMEGYWTQDEEPEWVPSRSALKRLPTHKDFATALETGEWKK